MERLHSVCFVPLAAESAAPRRHEPAALLCRWAVRRANPARR
jgi:hypothetical protein